MVEARPAVGQQRPRQPRIPTEHLPEQAGQPLDAHGSPRLRLTGEAVDVREDGDAEHPARDDQEEEHAGVALAALMLGRSPTAQVP